MKRVVLFDTVVTSLGVTEWLTETSEIKMSVIKSNDCNQGAQFSHQAENKYGYLTLAASSEYASSSD